GGSNRRRGAQQRVHVGAIRLVGGHATGRRVRMEEKTLLLQVAHRVANRRRRNAQAKATCQRPRAGRLGGLNVRLNDSFENATLALRQLLYTAHKFKCRNDFERQSRRLRASPGAASHSPSTAGDRRPPVGPSRWRSKSRKRRAPVW